MRKKNPGLSFPPSNIPTVCTSRNNKSMPGGFGWGGISGAHRGLITKTWLASGRDAFPNCHQSRCQILPMLSLYYFLENFVLESPLRWMEIAHDQPPPHTPFQKYWNSEVESFIFVVNWNHKRWRWDRKSTSQLLKKKFYACEDYLCTCSRCNRCKTRDLPIGENQVIVEEA